MVEHDGSFNQYESSDVYDQNEVIAAYDKAMAGGGPKTPAWNEYQLFVIDRLKYYSQQQIRALNRSNLEDKEDMESMVNLGIMSDLPKYNPRESSLTTFFVDRIKDYTKVQNPVKEHYRNCAKVCNRKLQEFGFPFSITDPQVTDALKIRIAESTKYSISTINETISQMRTNRVNWEDQAEVAPAHDGIYRNPEQIYIEEEMKSDLYKAIENSFNPFEQDILRKCGEENLTNRAIMKLYSSPEYREKYEKYIGVKKVDSDYINRVYISCIRRLKGNKIVKRHVLPSTIEEFEDITIMDEEEIDIFFRNQKLSDL